jgi:hypothetical protein
MDMKIESKAATSILLEIYSNSLLLLCIRCMCGVNQIGSLLQCMSIVLHLEQYHLLKLLDDSIWRSLFVASSAVTSGSRRLSEETNQIDCFSHKAICSFFVAFVRNCNLNLDAIVHTLYFKSFAKLFNLKKKKSPSNDPSTPSHPLYLDPFHHLEQLGVAWMMQKCSLPQSDLTNLTGNEKYFTSDQPPPPAKNQHQHPSSSPSGNGFWGMLRGKKKSPGQGSEESNQSLAKLQQQQQLQLQHFSSLPSDLTKILQLSRSEILFGLRKPRHLLVATLPIQSNPQELSILQKIIFHEENLETRVVELQELYDQFHQPEQSLLRTKAITELESKEGGEGTGTGGGEAIPPTIGKFEIAIAAVKGVVTPPNVVIKNIYVRCWLSIHSDLRLKSQPNLILVSELESSPSLLPFDPKNDFLAFHSIRPKNITVYFEVFGDYLRAQESSCYAFDQSLGIGTIPIEKISAENLVGNWIKLSYSTVGGKVIQIELFISTKFSPQENSKSFFSNKKETFRVKSQSYPLSTAPPSAATAAPADRENDKIPSSRESDGTKNSTNRFSWTKKITSVFTSGINKTGHNENPKPETVQEETTTQNSHDATSALVKEEDLPELPMAPSTPPLVPETEVEEDILERKSKKWRNSLAMLTGELDIDEDEDAATAGLDSSEPPNLEDPLRTSLRRSVESVVSQDSSDGMPRPSSMDLSLTPRKLQQKRLSVSAHPLGLGELLDDSVEGADSASPREQEPSNSEATPPPLLTEPVNNSVPSETLLPVTKPLTIETLSQENLMISNSSPPPTEQPASGSSLGKIPEGDHQQQQHHQQQPHQQEQREGSIATEVAGSVKSEYQNVQHIADIQSHFIKPISQERCGLGIYSITPCGHCGHTLLDEEVMAIWGGFCDHSKDMTSDLFSSHIIMCPLCKSDLIPKLHIQLYKLIPLDPTTSPTDLVEETSQLECLWSTEVRHLSPFGLRLLTEHVLEQDGFVIAEAEWMVMNHPDLYWNSLWYATRLNLPNGFYSSKDLSSIISSIPTRKVDSTTQPPFIWVSPMATSWRECVLQAKIRRILLDEHSEGILTLKDVYPGVTCEDEVIACEIINSMDGSVGNIASSLLRINQLTSIWNLFSGTKGRKLYLAFLSLVHFYHPPCLLQHSPEIPHGLSKVPPPPPLSPKDLTLREHNSIAH